MFVTVSSLYLKCYSLIEKKKIVLHILTQVGVRAIAMPYSYPFTGLFHWAVICVTGACLVLVTQIILSSDIRVLRTLCSTKLFSEVVVVVV